MYLIKEKGRDVNAQELVEDDVISINKKWYIVREKLGMDDDLKITGLRDQKPYTMKAVVGFGSVDSFRKVGRVSEDRWIEDLNIERKSITEAILNNDVTEA